jgi:hypothetical protein
LSHPASADVENEIRSLRPVLVIVDALRGFDPKVEKDNTAAGQMLAKWQQICAECHTALLLIHHIKKPDLDYPQRLVDADTSLIWLLQASGARALINQTSVRIGIDNHNVAPAELVLRGHYKLRGEIGPWQIARAYDESGEPIGYYRLTGIQLLTSDQQDAFARLPSEFRFTEAERSYGKTSKPTRDFLNRCIAVGVLEKHGTHKHTRYRKAGAGHHEVREVEDKRSD